MPLKADWYIKNQLIYGYGWDEVTEQDLATFLSSLENMVDESDAPIVHAVVDVTNVTKSLSLVSTVRVVRNSQPRARTGWTITVGEKDPFVKLSSNVGRQILKQRTRTLNTLNDAWAFLKQVDETLKWDKTQKTVIRQ